MALNVLFHLTGSRYWRYSTNFQLDPGYPKRLRGWYRSVQAAIQQDNGEIRVLKVMISFLFRNSIFSQKINIWIDFEWHWLFWKGRRVKQLKLCLFLPYSSVFRGELGLLLHFNLFRGNTYVLKKVMTMF